MQPGDSDLNRLAAKIAALRNQVKTPRSTPNRADSDAVRIVSDFIAAAIVGAGMGYGVDWWLETKPWGLVAGLMLGSAAGFRLMWQREQNARRRTAENEKTE
jgi:ATP synthase protein I